jgi:hypothetical protein
MENRIVSRSGRLLKALGVLGLAAGTALSLHVRAEGTPAPAGSDHVTVNPAYWFWDPVTPAGSSRLIRTTAGVSFNYMTGDLPPGQVVTVWVVVFNNPEHCATTPCTFADMANPDRPEVQSDFLYGGGHIIGGSGIGNFGGHLRVGDTSGSGLAEIGGMAVGLLNPMTAEIQLALHSHGPAVPGQTLKAQLTSFLGGCATFLGPDGIADGPEDMPVAVGECSTFQGSIHQPNF